MVSILTVPEQKPSPTVTVALTPADTREWLEKLPLEDARESLTRIYNELHDLNRIPVKPGIRLRLLEAYRKPVRFICENIETDLEAKDIPFADSQVILAEISRRATVEMAYGYKSVVLDLAGTIRSNRGNKDLCTAIHRAINYLSRTVFQSALYYNSWPPGSWIEIHSLFKYARKLGIVQTPVKDALNKSKPKNSIAHIYQQAVLFGVSDTYRHPSQIMGKLYRYLDRWASLVETSDYHSAPSTRCQFVVVPELDRPAQVLDSKSAPKRAKSMLLLDARAITNIAHSQWHEIRTGSKPSLNGHGEDFFDGIGFDMLEQAIRAWGVAPRRKYPRNPISGPFHLVLGIDGCVFCVNGERTFTRAFKNGSQNPPTTPVANSQQPVTPPGEKHTSQNWIGVNESTRGICLSTDLNRGSGVLIRIGEVVAYRTDRGNARWSAGLVRWVRITEAEIQAGIEQLGADCKPAAVQPLASSGNPENGFRSGIFVPADSDTQRQPSLVTPAGTFRNKRKLIIDDGTVTRLALAGRLVERSPHFDWFEFSLEPVSK